MHGITVSTKIALVNNMNSLFIIYILGESCKCNLLTRDDYNSMIVSTLGEFIGKHLAYIFSLSLRIFIACIVPDKV